MTRFRTEEPNGAAVQRLEKFLRAALFKPANEIVGWLLQDAVDRIDADAEPQLGERRMGRETLRMHGIFGAFVLERDYYYHPGKKRGRYPADLALGLEGSNTPALARLIALEGADQESYRQAQTHLRETGGIEVDARQVQRTVQRVGAGAQEWQGREAQPGKSEAPIMYVSADGTGVPVRKEERQGRKGKGADGVAKTRQAYLGCVFTQHETDEKGRPVRDGESTTYVSSLEGIGEFGPMLRQEALRRGLGGTERTVVLIDGACGLEHMGRDCFGEAVQIVDFYHASEHAGSVLAALLGGKEHPDYEKRRGRWTKRLLRNGVAGLIKESRAEAEALGRSEAVEKQLGYFVNNVERMQYGTFRKSGYFIGSGVVEAGCKTVIGSRCKQSGMFWGKPGAENVLALRCIHASRRLDEFWKHRLDQIAAANDTLPLAA